MPAKISFNEEPTDESVDEVVNPEPETVEPNPEPEVVTPGGKDDTKPGKKTWIPFDWKSVKKTTAEPVKPPKAGKGNWAAFVWGRNKAN